jgi:hypothetical protein
VGCYHLISGNNKGSISQFKKGMMKLNNYLPAYNNLNLETLLGNIDFIIKSLTKDS